jgi:hypothetical protein
MAGHEQIAGQDCWSALTDSWLCDYTVHTRHTAQGGGRHGIRKWAADASTPRAALPRGKERSLSQDTHSQSTSGLRTWTHETADGRLFESNGTGRPRGLTPHVARAQEGRGTTPDSGLVWCTIEKGHGIISPLPPCAGAAYLRCLPHPKSGREPSESLVWGLIGARRAGGPKGHAVPCQVPHQMAAWRCNRANFAAGRPIQAWDPPPPAPAEKGAAVAGAGPLLHPATAKLLPGGTPPPSGTKKIRGGKDTRGNAGRARSDGGQWATTTGARALQRQPRHGGRAQGVQPLDFLA